jgi:ribonuclease P protein subunit RPR2
VGNQQAVGTLYALYELLKRGILLSGMDKVYKEVQRLFGLAEKDPENPRYIRTAREILEKHRKSVPKEFSARFCKKCNTFFVPGKNCTVRIKGGTTLLHCNICGALKRVKTEQKI